MSIYRPESGLYVTQTTVLERLPDPGFSVAASAGILLVTMRMNPTSVYSIDNDLATSLNAEYMPVRILSLVRTSAIDDEGYTEKKFLLHRESDTGSLEIFFSQPAVNKSLTRKSLRKASRSQLAEKLKYAWRHKHHRRGITRVIGLYHDIAMHERPFLGIVTETAVLKRGKPVLKNSTIKGSWVDAYDFPPYMRSMSPASEDIASELHARSFIDLNPNLGLGEDLRIKDLRKMHFFSEN